MRFKLSLFLSLHTLLLGQAYVINGNNPGPIYSINTNTNVIEETITITGSAGPLAVAVTSDNKLAYISNVTTNRVYTLDVETSQVSPSSIPVGTYPLDIVVIPHGHTAYTANFVSNNMSVINLNTQAVSSIPMGTRPISLAISPDGAFVYCANRNSNNIYVINTSSNTVTSTITPSPAATPFGMAVTPDGTKLYVTCSNQNKILVYNTADNSLLDTISCPNSPQKIVITPNGTHAYVPTFTTNEVAVFETAGNTRIATVTVGAGPVSIAATVNGKEVYVCNQTAHTLSVIKTNTNTVQSTIAVGGLPNFITTFRSPQDAPTILASGSAQKNEFFTQTDLYNTVAWTPPLIEIPLEYQLYRDASLTDLITTLPGNVYQYEDHDRAPSTLYNYYLVGTSANDVTSLGECSVTSLN